MEQTLLYRRVGQFANAESDTVIVSHEISKQLISVGSNLAEGVDEAQGPVEN